MSKSGFQKKAGTAGLPPAAAAAAAAMAAGQLGWSPLVSLGEVFWRGEALEGAASGQAQILLCIRAAPKKLLCVMSDNIHVSCLRAGNEFEFRNL